MSDWLRRPEWAELCSLLSEGAKVARTTLETTAPDNAVAIAQAQAELRVYRYFLEGDTAQALLERHEKDD